MTALEFLKSAPKAPAESRGSARAFLGLEAPPAAPTPAATPPPQARPQAVPVEMVEEPGQPVPTRRPEPKQEEAIPEIRWDKTKDAAFRLLPDGKLAFDPDAFDQGVENAWKSGLLDGETYGKLKPAADEFRSAVEQRRKLEQEAGSLPEVKSFLQGAGRSGAMTLGFVGGMKGGGAAGLLAGPYAPVASPILAILGGVGGSIGAGRAYDSMYKKLAENDENFASMLASRDLEPAWGIAGELSGIVAPAALSTRALAQSTAVIAQAEGTQAAAMFAGKILGTGAATGAVVDPVFRGIDRALTPDQTMADILREGEREQLPIFSASGMATSALMMAALSGAGTRVDRTTLQDIFRKPRQQWTASESSAVDTALAATRATVREFGRGTTAENVLLATATLNNQPVAGIARVTGVRQAPAGLLGSQAAPAAAAPPAARPGLPGPGARDFLLGRGTAPVRPSAPGPIAAVGTARLPLPERTAPVQAPPPVTPVAVEPVSGLEPSLYTPVEYPLERLRLSEDVPNFKRGADPATGVVDGQQLEGTYDRLGTGAIIVWERANGVSEVISGRHRFDLARRSGEQTIPAQVVREADGFTTQDALTLDAELNIRDGQGTVGDYANYFRNSQITEDQAQQGSLLSRPKGRAGWAIGKGAEDDLYSAYQAGRISEPKAVAISTAAPNDAALQRAGMKHADKLKAEELPGFISYLRQQAGPKAEQVDLFGSDDSAIAESLRIAKAASSKAKEIGEQITAVRGAARRPEQAAKLGVDVRDPEGLTRRISELQETQQKYVNFYRHPEILAELGGQPAPAAVPPAGIPTIATTGEENLFQEQSMPFNLVSEKDTVSLTPEEMRLAQMQADRQAVAAAGQEEMFAGRMRGTTATPPPGPGPAATPMTPNWVLERPETGKGLSLVNRAAKAKAGFMDIVKHVNDAVNVEMRFSKSQTTRRNPAHYRPRGHMAFTRQNQSQINFHEAGHGLKELIEARAPGVFAGIDKALIDLTARPGSMASADNAHEGVAEWTRLKIMEPAALEEPAYAALDAQMSAILQAHAPKVAALIRDSARAVHKFQQLPVAQRWALFTKEAKEQPSLAKAWDALYRLGSKAAEAIASGAPVSKLDKDIFRATVRNRYEHNRTVRDALRLARENRARTNELIQSYNMILSIGAETVNAMSGTGPMKGLRVIGMDGNYRMMLADTWREIMTRVPGAKMEQFMQAGWALESLNRYAKDGLEYPGMREGIRPEDLREIVQQAKRDMPDFGKRFAEVQKYFDALLDIKDLGGLKAEGEVKAMRRRDLYWPMPRVMTKTGSVVGAQGRADIRAGDYRARGSGEAIEDLNTVAEARTRDALTSYYWNQFGLRMVNNTTAIAADKRLPLEARAIAGRAITRMKMPIQVAATLSREEGQKIVYEYVLKEMAKEMGVDPALLGTTFKPENVNLSWEFKDIFRPTNPDDVNVVSLLRDGKREFYQLGDPSMFGMFARPEQVSTMMRAVQWALGPMMQNWKRNITQSLPFSVANLAGDVINQVMLNKDSVGWIPGGATMIGAMNKFTKKYPQVFQEGILLSRVEPSKTELVNQVKHNSIYQWLTEGFYVSQAKDPTVRVLATIFQPSNLLFPVWKVADLINLVTLGRVIAPSLETATREGAAASVKASGGTDMAAADAYWRVTGRFNEHAGIADARAAMSLPGFFNPMLQAVRGSVQVLFDPDPAVAGAAWSKLLIMVPAIFGSAAVARFLLMSDEDRERERNRPIEDRLNYHDIAGFRIRFPYGPEGAMGSFIYNATMDYLLDRPKEDGKRTGIMLAKRIGDLGTPLQFLGPQLNSMSEAQMNWSNFRQQHIISPWMVRLPASEQYYASTPEFYRKLGAWADYSPAKIEYMVAQGISRQANEMIKLLSNIEQNKPIQEGADIPFIGRMFLRDPVGFGSAPMQTLQEIETRMQLLDRRLASDGYAWIKNAPVDEIGDPKAIALRRQIDSLMLLRTSIRQIQQLSSLSKAARINQDYARERNYQVMMTRSAQSALASNPEAVEQIETALELLKSMPETTPSMKAADYLNRRF
jgi:hypothetical protein